MKEKIYETITEQLCPFCYMICLKKEENLCPMPKTDNLQEYSKQAKKMESCQFRGQDLSYNEYIKKQKIKK